MKTLTWSVIGLVLLGLVAAFCAVLLVSLMRPGAPSGAPAAPLEIVLVVASKALPAMAVVNADSVTTTTVAVTSAPAGAFSDVAGVLGKPLAAPMVKGQPFTRSCFVAEGTGQDLAAKIPDGMRAVSLSLPEHTRLEGLLYPGAVVDVMASFTSPADAGGQSQATVSTSLLQGVQVLAVGGQTVMAPEDKSKPQPTGQRLVTLLVDPSQAKALQLAILHGSVWLTLRPPLDQQRGADEKPMVITDLVKFPSAAPPAAAVAAAPAEKDVAKAKTEAPPEAAVAKPVPPPRWEVTVIRGSARETVVLDLPLPGSK
jgi:pilus assembly protein CpaB